METVQKILDTNRARAQSAQKVISLWTTLQAQWLSKAHQMELELQELCAQEEAAKVEKEKEQQNAAAAAVANVTEHPLIKMAIQAVSSGDVSQL
eukprot:5466027-Karenia_brevis.AAC.1